MLLDELMPRWDVATRHEALVRAPASTTYRAARAVDLAGAPIAKLLFRLRGFPQQAHWDERTRTWTFPTGHSLTLESALRAGFVLLGERPGSEIVIGGAGRFWTLSGGRVAITPAEFASFARPGMAKAAFTLRVEADGADRSRLITETRVLCVDDEARRSFKRYWRLILPGVVLIRRAALGRIRREAERRERAV